MLTTDFVDFFWAGADPDFPWADLALEEAVAVFGMACLARGTVAFFAAAEALVLAGVFFCVVPGFGDAGVSVRIAARLVQSGGH